MIPGTPEDHHPNAFVSGNFLYGVPQALDHFPAHGVHHIGAIQGQGDNVFLCFDDNGL